jgi:hypothetical protein
MALLDLPKEQLLLHTFYPLLAIALGLLLASLGFLPEQFRPLPSGNLLLGVIFALLIGIPFTYLLPIARANWMHRALQVPRDTFLLSRPLVRLAATGLLGMAIGSVILSVWSDSRHALLCVLCLGLFISLIISASRRFKRHPATEFVMPVPFPYPLRRRM